MGYSGLFKMSPGKGRRETRSLPHMHSTLVILMGSRFPKWTMLFHASVALVTLLICWNSFIYSFTWKILLRAAVVNKTDTITVLMEPAFLSEETE